MVFTNADRVRETSTTTGTGDMGLAGAVAGYTAFTDSYGSGDYLTYAIVHRTVDEWEVGIGLFNGGGNSITRTPISSGAGGTPYGATLLNFTAGTKDVFVTAVGSRTLTLGEQGAVLIPEATPTTNPPSNQAKLYAFDRFGRTVLRYRTPGGNVIQLAQDDVIVVRNQTGSTIPAFSTVYSSGSGSGAEPLVALADADNPAAMPCLGIAMEAIGNNSNGFAMIAGVLVDVPTAGFSVDDILFVSGTAGGFTTTAPTHPSERQRIARILVSHASAGVALVTARQPTGAADSGLRLVNISVPAAPPPALNLDVYARSRAGRMFLEMLGPSGIDTSLQPALFANNVVMWLPGTGTTAAIAFGQSWTVAATQAHPAITTGAPQPLNSLKRATFTTTAVALNAAGIRASAVGFWRGNAAGLGGFFFFARIAVVTFQSSMQIWAGLSAATGLLAGEPSAQANTVALVKDTADTNWFLAFRDGSTTTKVNLGLAVAASQMFDVMFFCPPNGSNITARIVRLDSASVLADNTVHTANLPVSTALLVPHVECRTNAASAVAIALNRIYIESDL